MDIAPIEPQLRYRQQLKNDLAALRDELDQVETIIKDFLGDETDGHLDGNRVVYYSKGGQNRVDVTRLREEQPDVANEYLRFVPSRSLQIEEEF